MAEDLQTGICSGGSWWNPERSASFDSPTSLSCSTATADIRGRAFSWTATELIEAKARSCDESAVSTCGSPITFQETHKVVQHPDDRPSFIDSTMPSFSLSSSNMNWTQAVLNGGRPESSFHAMLQEDLGSRSYCRQDPSTPVPTGAESSAVNPFSNMNQNFSLDQQHHFSSGNESSDVGVGSYHIIPASYAGSSMMLQGLLEAETKQQQSIYDNQVMNRYQSPMVAYQGSPNELWQPNSWAKLSQLLKSSLSKQQSHNQLQFTNNTPFWNASAAASVTDVRSFLCPPSPSQFVMQPKTICRNLTAKMNPEGAKDSCSSPTKETGSEPAIKKPRIETPSPLPTFKVRKEKLGDRITALQQLVSPFGKTDTASVLQEAIEYIRFLHDQVGVLSSPYLKNGHPMQQKQTSDKSKDCDETKQDLRSRGLCLVPITSTYPVASETTADFWHPTFGGTFR